MLYVKKCALNFLPNDKILDQSKFKAFADDKNQIRFENSRKHCGKRRKIWLPEKLSLTVFTTYDFAQTKIHDFSRYRIELIVPMSSTNATKTG